MSRKAGVTDYSKWDNIEISDDESDCHPNIEKGTWFRLKHQQRVERERQEAKEKKEMEEANQKDEARIAEIAKLEATPELNDEKKKLEEAIAKRKAKLEKMEKNKKWNVDNICHVVEERSVVNHEAGGYEDGYALPPMTDKDREYHESEEKEAESYGEFEQKFKGIMEEFVTKKSLEDTKEYLIQHGDVLLQKHASWWLLLHCLQEEMKGKRKEMKHAARQSQILSSITELSKAEKRHPGNIIEPFFHRLQDPRRFQAFLEGVNGFADRIVERAVQKKKEEEQGLPPGGDPFLPGTKVEAHGLKTTCLNGVRGVVKGRTGARIGVIFPKPHGEKAIKPENLRVLTVEEETIEEEAKKACEDDPNKCWWLPNDRPREERLGPGGLDPVEVFAELPRCLQDAFRSREIEPLHKAIEQLGHEEAEKHMNKCIAAGLWDPPADDDDEEEEPKEEEKPQEGPKLKARSRA